MKLFIFQLWVSNSKWNLIFFKIELVMFYEVELVTRKKNFSKNSRVSNSKCGVILPNLILQLENSEPRINRECFKIVQVDQYISEMIVCWFVLCDSCQAAWSFLDIYNLSKLLCLICFSLFSLISIMITGHSTKYVELGHVQWYK